MRVLLAAAEGENYFSLVEELRAELPDLEVVRATTPDETLAHLPEADVFYGFPTAELVAAAPKLRWIQSPSAGVEYVARVPELVASDVILTNTRGAHGPSIAEHVFALLLAFTRGVPQAIQWKARRHWGRKEGYRTLREIKGSTMGIIGYGAIGRAVAQRAIAFEMTPLALDAQAIDTPPFVDEVLPPSRLPELLQASQVLVVAAPLTAETRHMIGAMELAMLPPEAIVIAVSRGGIIDETALDAALREGHLAGAALDVTEIEPLPDDSPLWETPNLIITPHLAGASGPKERRCVEILCENVRRFARGEALHNVVDKRLGY